MPIFHVKSVKIYTGKKFFTRIYSWRSWQISGMICIIWSGCPTAGGHCNTDTDHPDGRTTFKRGIAVLYLFWNWSGSSRGLTTFRRGVAVLIFFVYDMDHPEDPATCKEDGPAQQLLFANKPDHRRQGGFITPHLPKECLKIANCKCLLFLLSYFSTFAHLHSHPWW